MSWPAGRSSSRTSPDGRLYRLDPGADAPGPDHPGGAVPLRRPAARPRPAPRSSPSARTTPARGEAMSTIVTIPLDGGDPRVLVAGSDFVAAPRLSPDGARLAWLEWDHPDMPWDATRLRVAPRSSRTGRSANRPSPRAAPTSRSSSPSGRPTGRSTSSATGPAGGTSTGWSTGPRLEPLAPMEAEFADPAWIFDRSSYGFLADGAIVAVARSGGRDHLYRIEPGLLVGEVEIAVHGARRAPRRRAHGRRDRRLARAIRRSSPGSTR